VTEKLKDELKEFGKDPAIKKMEQAARASGGNDSQNLAGLQKQLESMQKQLGTPTGNPDALDKIKKELDKLKEAAQSMGNQNSPMSDAEKQKFSESLSALSKQMQAMGMQLPQLDDAIDALAANQTDMVLKDLEAATVDLEKMRDMAKSLQQMQQQMEKLGKDLAEQLKNGQPEVAQMTMQKMIQQLKSSNLSPEQLQKLTDEVAKAVDPAGNYGKVAEHLKEAAQQMNKPARNRWQAPRRNWRS
jgi:predicted  nucleic acid-binding Zn-ribbon protein